MRRTDERFRLLVESVRDYAIFMLDPEGHVLTFVVTLPLVMLGKESRPPRVHPTAADMPDVIVVAGLVGRT